MHANHCIHVTTISLSLLRIHLYICAVRSFYWGLRGVRVNARAYNFTINPSLEATLFYLKVISLMMILVHKINQE